MKRLAAPGLILALMFGAAYGIAESRGWLDPDGVWLRLESAAAHPGGRWAGAGLVVGLLAADLVLPVPSSIVMTFSGALLGFAAGAAASFAGSMAAAWIGFAACRWGGQRMFARLAGARDLANVDAWFRRRGVVAIILSRPIPMLTEILSCLAGLSGLSTRTFLLANLCGHLPVSLLYAYAGARGARGEYGLAIFAILLIPAAGWVLAQRIRRGTAAGGDAENGGTR